MQQPTLPFALAFLDLSLSHNLDLTEPVFVKFNEKKIKFYSGYVGNLC